MRALLATVLFLATLALGAAAHAYTIGSSVTDPCHEQITLDSLERVAPPVIEPGGTDPERWRELAAYTRRVLSEEAQSNPSADAIFLAAVLGVRHPDLLGNAPIDLSALRHVHLDDSHQASHFLRRSVDDGRDGGERAVEASRARLEELVDASAVAYASDPDGHALVRVPVWVESYGTVEVEVWEPMFLLAQALHLLQDSFTHTYRTDDARRIVEVGNYVEAVGGHYAAGRDGPRHSGALDACNDPAIAALREAATEASAELVGAAFELWATGEHTPVEAVLEKWLELDDECRENVACEPKWIAIARASETGPLLSCSVGRAGALARSLASPGVLFLAASLLRFRRSRRRRDP
jgi:hypothetical protein